MRLQFANGNTDSIDRLDYDTFVHKWFSHNREWKPSLFMPKVAARIWLKVTDVRVERLQEITSEQICREGVEVEYPHVLNGEEKDMLFQDSGILPSRSPILTATVGMPHLGCG